MRIDGTQQRLVYQEPGDKRIYDWSPDGRYLLFKGDDYQMGRLEVDTGEITLLGRGFLPNWSPDGTKIAFVSVNDLNENDIYVMDSDGQNVQRLTYLADNLFVGGWSPDGSRITFQIVDKPYWSDLYVMDADGSNIQLLDRCYSVFTFPASWSPDSRYMAYSKLNKIAIYDLETGQSESLPATRGKDKPSSIDWSVDGTQLLFTRIDDGVRHVYLYDIDTGQLTKAVNILDNRDAIAAGWRPQPQR